MHDLPAPGRDDRRAQRLRLTRADRVERGADVVARRGLELRRRVGVAVVEYRGGAERTQELEVARGGGCRDFVARERAELDRELADGGCT